VILDLHEIFPEFTRAKYPGLLGDLAAQVEPVERAVLAAEHGDPS